MYPIKARLIALAVIVFVLAARLAPSLAAGKDDGCEGAEGYSYLCGLVSAEDLVQVPGTRWIIASGFAGDVSLYLIDSEQKTWGALYPADEPVAIQDMKRYGSCPGSPDPNGFEAHGLSIRPGVDGHSTLYVVGHGEREAIEMFDVDATGDTPVLTWTGCVLTPDGMPANSVTASADGSLLVTIPLHPGFDISQILAGQPTGAVYSWSPGAAALIRVEGTEMPYANGIEVSADGKEFYIASSGLLKVVAFSNTNPAEWLRSSELLSFIPDNIHWDSEGRLMTAGLDVLDPVCGDVQLSENFDFAWFMGCPRPFTVVALDPQSLQSQVIARSPAQANFSNITTALTMDDEIWIGTFAGDRIAYRQLETGDD